MSTAADQDQRKEKRREAQRLASRKYAAAHFVKGSAEYEARLEAHREANRRYSEKRWAPGTDAREARLVYLRENHRRRKMAAKVEPSFKSEGGSPETMKLVEPTQTVECQTSPRGELESIEPLKSANVEEIIDVQQVDALPTQLEEVEVKFVAPPSAKDTHLAAQVEGKIEVSAGGDTRARSAIAKSYIFSGSEADRVAYDFVANLLKAEGIAEEGKGPAKGYGPLLKRIGLSKKQGERVGWRRPSWVHGLKEFA